MALDNPGRAIGYYEFFALLKITKGGTNLAFLILAPEYSRHLPRPIILEHKTRTTN